MINEIVDSAPIFLLIAVRVAGLVFTLPLFSMRTVSRTAKIAFVGYLSYLLMAFADYSAYSVYIKEDGAFSLIYMLLLLGEGIIGVIIGFYVSIIFAAFSTAAQFFAFQMGFSAASTYDQLSQVENPLLGQFFNFASVLLFLQIKFFQKIFLQGLSYTVESFNVFCLIENRDRLITFLIKGLSNLFADAFLIALPIMGTLVLITICTGLLSKAAPQMNLLSEGFPVMILLSFGILVVIFPHLFDFFSRSFNTGISDLLLFFSSLGKGGA
ncbi:MAG: flagellar biosynthetic protein FliR [Treponema sp.]|nr:flagellar biosynthetic protein FliR [Treponema sp.]